MQVFGSVMTMVPSILSVALWATALVLLTRYGSSGRQWRQLAAVGLVALLVDSLAGTTWLWLVLAGRVPPLGSPGVIVLVNLAGTVLRLTGYGLLVAALFAGRRERGDQLAA